MTTTRRVALVVFALACALSPVAADDGVTSGLDEYRIGPEDVLEVITSQPLVPIADAERTATEYVRTVRVRPDGRITLPVVNDIEVGGLTPNEVRLLIQERVSDYIKDPTVTVIVTEINSFRVFFLGEIQNKGVQTFLRPTRLLQGIATAGGLSEYSDKRVVIIREIGGLQKRIDVNLKRLLAGDAQAIEANIWLEPGDTLLFQ